MKDYQVEKLLMNYKDIEAYLDVYNNSSHFNEGDFELKENILEELRELLQLEDVEETLVIKCAEDYLMDF